MRKELALFLLLLAISSFFVAVGAAQGNPIPILMPPEEEEGRAFFWWWLLNTDAGLITFALAGPVIGFLVVLGLFFGVRGIVSLVSKKRRQKRANKPPWKLSWKPRRTITKVLREEEL